MTGPGLNADRTDTRAYLVGGGIASLSAAVFLIRDGDVLGRNITIIEESGTLGGSLDASGSPEDGYVMRGGRMLERKYVCTFDLFSSIPTLDERWSVTQETFAWNETMETSSKSRLVRGGKRQDAPLFGLKEGHILAIERLTLEPEALLRNSSIADQFDEDFFTTDFWFMWCTTFAFQPWHSAVEFKRYLVRFAHMVDGFDRLRGIMRTVYNQYDSMVRPLRKWLEARDVRFEFDTKVTDLDLTVREDKIQVTEIACLRAGRDHRIAVAAGDLVLVTLGSMTEASSLGAMDRAPQALGKADGGAWMLWEALAKRAPVFGRPATFTDRIDQSKWVSFTITTRDPSLPKAIVDLTGNVPGEGGLITFPDSPWLASIVIPHQPHFIDQPADVSVLWGYGLAVDKLGKYIRKPMAACTGAEIRTEVLGHLGIRESINLILDSSICIPCMMPFITSQFLTRSHGDRPRVVPEGSQNLAFMGQFCELPGDVVFTVEYSIRSAQTAVYSLLGLKLKPPAMYRGEFDPGVLYKAFRALHDIRA